MSEYTQQPPPDLAEVLSRINDDLSLLRTAAERQIGAKAEQAREFVQQHPYGALSVALSCGYLLGGGLLSRWTLRALGVGVRIASARALRSFIGTIGAVAGADYQASGESQS